MTRRRAAILGTALLVATAACSDSRTPARVRDAPPTTVPPSTAPTVPISTTPPCPPDPNTAPAAPVPPDLAQAVERFATDQRVSASAVGASIWVDGLGEVGALQPDLPLYPASNQKLLTAMGVLATLGPEARFTTDARVTTTGDLVIVAGGDPSLAGRGPHSLETLAARVRAEGVSTVPGALLVDESRDDAVRRAPGWQDWQFPTYAGPISAFMVDRNRYRTDPPFLGDPALANAELFRLALAAHGVGVAGPTRRGEAPADARTVASLTSDPVSVLLMNTLLHSDNMAAELMLKEVGRAAAAQGSTPAGIAATHAALAPLCVPIRGADDDGSGLSRADHRSAREWRVLLQGARTQPWWPVLLDALPVAGRTGTLAARFRGTAAAENVRAKTGTIIGGIALSGYGTTASGRAFVFSVIVNGNAASGAVRPLDALIAAVAASRA